MASTKDTKTISLRSSDGQAFKVPEQTIADASAMIKALLDAGHATTDVVPLPNVTAATLSRVLDYVNKHSSDPDDSESVFLPRHDRPLARFDDDFVNVDDNTLFDLITAAADLQIEKLLDLTSKAMAERIKGKTAEDIRKRFNIVNDYNEEDAEEVCRENSWAFE
ncbi:hypothetical protein EJB05_21168 [Eragrostis curvula]|uniref:SKP1-like protein n=1 Tax=Eragrostis curvula TaxID=38414 RepID=A0A5J9V248_9POAL|nr:hypothetical protein EJB05_21168 [Eragrostis curvula]